MATVYDKSSLFLAPSGVSNGTVFTQKPVPIYGPELVTNGDFATDSDWSKGTGWTISGGTASFNGGADAAISQSSVVTSGTEYKVLFTISDLTTSGSLQLRFGSTGSVDKTINKNGTYYFHLTADGTTLYFRAISGFNGSIDNVSVQEVLTDGADFTFSRGSNLSATRVNADGLIEKGRENLLLQSNSFDTTWQTSNTTPLSGYADRNGGTDAWLLREDATTSAHWIRQSSGLYSGIGTFSFYAKKKDYDYIQFARSGDGGDYANFNISNGTLGNVSGASIINREIESVGNGWYRCSVTYSFGSNSYVGIALIRSDVSSRYETYAGDVTKGAYIQDAQLEIGLAATSVITTGAGTVQAGLLENTPRLDYSSGATCPSLLLEPSRTNLAGKSEYIGGWGYPTNVTLTQNYGISPEGLTNSTRLQFTSNGFMNDALSQVNGTQYTLSIYAKRNDGGTQSFGFYVNGTPTIVGGITLTSDWQRFTYTYTASNSFSIGLAGSSGADVSVYGFQVEQGSYPTSYIPNHSGGSVTRGADVLDRGSNLAYTGNYTLFMEFNLTKDAVYFLNSTTSSSYTMFIENDDAYFKFGRTIGDAANVYFTSSFDWGAALGTSVKFAFVKNGTTAAMFVNGTKYTPSTNTLTTGNEVLDWRYLDYSTLANRQEQAYIKQLVEFQTALSDTDCEILTGATTYETFEEMALALNYTVYE